MEQQLDVFTQKRFELIIELATKKLQGEIMSVKETLCSMAGEINSLKSQISRLQFQPPQARTVQKTLGESQNEGQATQSYSQPKKDVHIVDCRPNEERKQEFVSGSAKNAEPIRPRYGDYEPKDVSIEKFFYFGRK